jgi:hypothetical protein
LNEVSNNGLFLWRALLLGRSFPTGNVFGMRRRLCFVQEETQRGYVHGSSSIGHEEENVALATTSKKKFKKGPKGGNKPKGEGKKDMSKVKCFACHKFGHYVGQCPNKKKKQTTASAGGRFFHQV